MSKVALNNITGGYAAVDLLNENFDAIEAAFDNTLSRDGSTPNTWLANQDANHKRLLNLGDPIDDKDAVNKEYVINAVVDATPIAFAKAAYYVDRFTGDGSDTTFTLTTAPGLGTNSQVYINGAYQNKNTYAVNGTTLTFTEAPPLGSDIEVVVVQPVAAEVNAAANITIADAGNYYSSGYVEGALQEVMVRARQQVSVKDFGAVGDGVTDDTDAINNAIAAAPGVFFPSGTYLVTNQINIKSNLSISGEGGSKILLDAGITPYVLRGDFVDNFAMQNLEIEGNGESGYSTVYISNATNVYINNCTITKSGATALYIVNTNFAKVENCILSSNYYYGLEFRDCTGCKAIANYCANNGDTGVATSTGGRGIMLWRSNGCYIAGNRLVNNNEYGFRIYSEAADTTTSNNNVVTGNVFVDNGQVDFVLYDEGAAYSFIAYNVISDNIVYRSTNAAQGYVYLLHGDYNTFVNNHVYKSGAFGTNCGFNFYNANYCTLSNSSVHNMAQAFSTSSCSNITIDNCFGNGVANGLTIPTENVVVRNSKFLHGGTGATDICINNSSATGKNLYENNYISGFYQGIAVDDEPVALFGNTTVGSTNAGLRKTGNVTATIDAANNSWDSANPFLLSAYSRTGSTHDQAVIKYPNAPTSLTWTRGDTAWNEEPAVGFPIGWVCTVAGTPGTWVAMQNL